MPFSLSLSVTQLSSSPKTLSISQALILSHRHSLNLPHSLLLARPSRPKPPIASPSLSSLIVTLLSSLIHPYLPNPTVPSYRSPHTHAADRLRLTPPTHPFCHPSSPTLCLFVIGNFFILFVIGDFVWSGLRKKIGDLSFLFIYFSCCGLVVVVIVGVVMADNRGGCG